MEHPVHKIKSFEIVGPYRLRIEFVDGLVRTIDFRSVLEGELYGPYGTSIASTRLTSIAKLTRSSGRTVRTSTPQFFTTGLTTKPR
jgi:hypothetical protein